MLPCVYSIGIGGDNDVSTVTKRDGTKKFEKHWLWAVFVSDCIDLLRGVRR